MRINHQPYVRYAMSSSIPLLHCLVSTMLEGKIVCPSGKRITVARQDPIEVSEERPCDIARNEIAKEAAIKALLPRKEIVRDLFMIDPESPSGIAWRRDLPNGRKMKGRPAGTLHGGYRTHRVKLYGRWYRTDAVIALLSEQ